MAAENTANRARLASSARSTPSRPNNCGGADEVGHQDRHRAAARHLPTLRPGPRFSTCKGTASKSSPRTPDTWGVRPTPKVANLRGELREFRHPAPGSHRLDHQVPADDLESRWSFAEPGRRARLNRSVEMRLTCGNSVETMGFEPTTPCLQSRCSSQLSYVPGGVHGTGHAGSGRTVEPRPWRAARSAESAADHGMRAPTVHGGLTMTVRGYWPRRHGVPLRPLAPDWQ